ncbi:MAG: hypothetical protein RMH84_03205, partial [Sulfolobales archaeon]|nr:hypothetical protein [Sulfolobales archaeon]MDW8010585.1 hypothetical protein [Sulfolobales archaeon]
VLKTCDNRFDALLSVLLGGRRFYMIVSGLARAPKEVKIVEVESSVKLELLDQFGHGFLTCVLNREFFESEFASVKCSPGNVWIISEDTIARHRSKT